MKVSEEPALSSLTEEQQSAVTELKELQTLLPELEEKIADIQASKDSTVKKLQTLMVCLEARQHSLLRVISGQCVLAVWFTYILNGSVVVYF